MLLKLGSKGEDVIILQRRLNVDPTGNFGELTRNAVLEYQKKHGLTVDGLVGKSTWGHMFPDQPKQDPLVGLVPEEVRKYLDEVFNLFNINTPKRKAMFLAQCSHESGGFKLTEENLNYSRDALLKVFGKYFNESNVDEYVRNPEKIANVTYANRMGNGDSSSGEGWKYRGRGLIQLTGRNNYILYGNVSDPDSLCKMPEALYSAARYWAANDLNRYADADDIVGSTRVINGGQNGIEDRKKRYDQFKKVF